MSQTGVSDYDFSEDDIEALVAGGQHVVGNTRFYKKLSWQETEHDYSDRLRRVSYRNHSKAVLINYDAYTISDESVMLDDTVNVEQRIRSILQFTNMHGLVWVLGLKDTIEIFKPSQYTRKGKLIILSKRNSKERYEIDSSNPNNVILSHFIEDVLAEDPQSNFDIRLLARFQFNDMGIALIADVAPQSVAINTLRSVTDEQAFKTLKDWRYGPAPEEGDEKIETRKSAYIAVTEGDKGIPGIIQYDPQNMTSVNDLVQFRTLELATEVNLVEEFSTELKNVAESSVAKQVRRAALTALVKLMAKILQKGFNIIQQARFDAYGVGIVAPRTESDDSIQLAENEPNLVTIKARVFNDEADTKVIDFFDAVLRLVATEKAAKVIKKLAAGLLPLSEEDLRILLDDIEKNSKLADNLLNMGLEPNPVA